MPDADDLPAFTPQLPVHAFVAGYVGLAFTVPEGAVGALGADVPIASAVRRQKVRAR